jgi:hypothetical protein
VYERNIRSFKFSKENNTKIASILLRVKCFLFYFLK